MITFSIVIPTISRTTLRRTLMSIKHAAGIHQDQIIVVGDGYNPDARRMSDQLCPAIGVPHIYDELSKPTGSGSVRMRAFTHATATHLAFIDDDDAYTPEALLAMRNRVALFPDVPHVFKMRQCNHDRAHWRELWADPVLRIGNVGTPMVVLPNVREKLAEWKDEHLCDDFYFFEKTFKNFGPAQWHHEVVADIY